MNNSDSIETNTDNIQMTTENSLQQNNPNQLIPEPAPSQSILNCLLYTSPSPRDATLSRMPSSA